jgi:hypothetical protein
MGPYSLWDASGQRDKAGEAFGEAVGFFFKIEFKFVLTALIGLYICGTF